MTIPSSAGEARNAVTFIGHSTTLIELEGTRVLTDPLLCKRVVFLLRQVAAVEMDSLTGIDAVVLSHLHRDHCHLRSLRRLPPTTPMFVPVGAARVLRKAGFSQVTELAVGERQVVGSVTIEAVEALHSGFRPPFGPHADSLGFLVSAEQSVYFAGDTALFPEMEALKGRVDLALLPVWGWGPNLRGHHMDPADAAQALYLIQPRMAIPVHWGTYAPIGFGALKPRYLHEPPRTFMSLATAQNPAVVVRLLQPGATLNW
jgi:L-ascorbate metabolism protein UlaG (beta-lactamase superfamily)